MSTDSNRAAFVQQPYRYEVAQDATVKARNPLARTLEINTNLDEPRATALAALYLSENKSPRVFEVVLEGVMSLSSLSDGVPRFILDDPRFATDGRTLKLVSFTTDYEANTTTLQVRG